MEYGGDASHHRTARGGCSCGHVHGILPEDPFDEAPSSLSADLVSELTALGLSTDLSALRHEMDRRLRDMTIAMDDTFETDAPKVRIRPHGNDGWLAGVDPEHPGTRLAISSSASGASIEEALARFAIALMETSPSPTPGS